jgi:hypothetical protein
MVPDYHDRNILMVLQIIVRACIGVHLWLAGFRFSTGKGCGCTVPPAPPTTAIQH